MGQDLKTNKRVLDGLRSCSAVNYPIKIIKPTSGTPNREGIFADGEEAYWVRSWLSSQCWPTGLAAIASAVASARSGSQEAH